jgi:Zn ribbon nucleic-acid-binding protein
VRSIFRAAARETARRLRLPSGSRCTDCQSSDSLALLPETKPVRCVDCHAKRRRQKRTQDHHPLGRANNPDETFPVRLSTHRFLTDRQEDWPTETLTNPAGCPIVRKAAALRAFVDNLAFLEKYVLLPRAPELKRRHARGDHAR